MDKNTNGDLREIFGEVRVSRGYEEIVNQVKKLILQGKLKAGDRLPNERELVKQFKVSRPTIREALRVLENEGFLEVRRGIHGGSYIIEPNPSHAGRSLEALIRFHGATVSELIEFRANFEAESAYWAARRATVEQIRNMFKLAEEVGILADNQKIPWSKFVEKDIQFHEEVALATHNQIRLAIMLAIREVFKRTVLMIEDYDSKEWRLQQIEDLFAIAEAIGKRQEEIARKRMEEHVLRNIKALQSIDRNKYSYLKNDLIPEMK